MEAVESLGGECLVFSSPGYLLLKLPSTALHKEELFHYRLQKNNTTTPPRTLCLIADVFRVLAKVFVSYYTFR